MKQKIAFNQWTVFEVQPGDATEISKINVLFSGGSGNMDIKNRGSNVFKLYEAIDIHGHKTPPHDKKPQVAFYDDGLGTKVPYRLFGQAFGAGFAENDLELAWLKSCGTLPKLRKKAINKL